MNKQKKKKRALDLKQEGIHLHPVFVLCIVFHTRRVNFSTLSISICLFIYRRLQHASSLAINLSLKTCLIKMLALIFIGLIYLSAY